MTPPFLARKQSRRLELANVGGALASGLGTLAEHGGRLVATETSTPLTTSSLVLVRAVLMLADDVMQVDEHHVQVGLGSLDEGSELALVLGADLLDGEDGGGLLVDDRAEAGLALDDDVGDAHLAAERGEEDNELNGVDIVGDDNERRLLGLNERDAVVETILDEEGLLGVLPIAVRISPK